MNLILRSWLAFLGPYAFISWHAASAPPLGTRVASTFLKSSSRRQQKLLNGIIFNRDPNGFALTYMRLRSRAKCEQLLRTVVQSSRRNHRSVKMVSRTIIGISLPLIVVFFSEFWSFRPTAVGFWFSVCLYPDRKESSEPMYVARVAPLLSLW